MDLAPDNAVGSLSLASANEHVYTRAVHSNAFTNTNVR